MTDLTECGPDVSRETLDALETYCRLLEKWTSRINLIAPSTTKDIWTRHILDSAQLFSHAPEKIRHWVDLGSGGGLPAIVCAILAREHRPQCRFTLMESDKRKSAFLISAAQTLGLDLTVRAERVETAPPQSADVVSARALAPLPQLLFWVTRHLGPSGVAMLPKGKNYATELAAARAEWQFDCTAIDSLTDPLAKILILKEVSRV